MNREKADKIKAQLLEMQRQMETLQAPPKLSAKGKLIAEIVRGVDSRQFYVVRVALAQMLAIALDDDPIEMAKAVQTRGEGWPNGAPLRVIKRFHDINEGQIVFTRYADYRALQMVDGAFLVTAYELPKPENSTAWFRIATHDELENFLGKRHIKGVDGNDFFDYIQAFWEQRI